MVERTNLRDHAFSGALWAGLEKVFRQGAQFLFGIVLARLLDPSDYGIIGMMAIFISVANTFVDSGMAMGLVQRQNRSEKDYSTVFYFNFVVSLIFYIILFIAAPYIASFYNISNFGPILRVLSFTLVINALGTINQARLTIQLKFKEQSIIAITSTIVTGCVGIILAYNGYGVWALVFQSIASSIVTLFLTFYHSRWFPKTGFSKESFKNLFGFGSKILGTSLLYTLYTNAYTLVIGKAFNSTQVGYYNRGNQYAMLPHQTVMDMIHKILFPILSKVQDDIPQLVRAYKKMTSVPIFILYPILIGLAVLAGPLVELMIGGKWLPCVPFIQVLCIGNIFGALSDLNLNLLLVRGRSDLLLKLDLIKKPIAFAILFASVPLGIFWMVVFKAIYEIVAFLFNCYYTKKLLDYGALSQIMNVLPILIKSCVMGAVTCIPVYIFDNNLVIVLTGTLLGMMTYWLLAIISKDESYYEILGMIKSRIK